MAKNKALTDLLDNIKFTSKLNQSQIAEKLGVSKQYLSDVVNCRFPFTEELKEKIYVTFTYLTNESNTSKNSEPPKQKASELEEYATWLLPARLRNMTQRQR